MSWSSFSGTRGLEHNAIMTISQPNRARNKHKRHNRHNYVVFGGIEAQSGHNRHNTGIITLFWGSMQRGPYSLS